ncbi:MAG TPA: TIGR03435 family protein [Vicinamibacterales bacterium]|nr:TIGR03435 family protein [Vicinamibacterales bacterium]
MRFLYTLGLALMTSLLVQAEPPEHAVEFEVATVKKSPPPGTENSVTAGIKMDGSQVRIGALALRDYIAMAYRVKVYQITGPDWMATERFDIAAKLPAGVKADQFPAMMQSLLADRFGLKFHREPKEMPVYALMVGKPPLKLKDSAVDPTASAPNAVEVSGTGSAAGVAVNLGNGSSYTFAGGKFEARKIDGRIMADMLERYTDRPVIDATELTGRYDFSFEVMPEEYQTLLIRAAVNSGVVLPPQALRLLDNGGDPLGNAVGQLGLKLESRKAPVDLFVVDQILRTPTEN